MGANANRQGKKMELELIEVMEERDPRIPRKPVDSWWRLIPKTPAGGMYITSAAALNIPQEGEVAGWHGLAWNTRLVRPGNDGTRDSVQLGHPKEWPCWRDAGILDVREGLCLIGHPAGQRDEPVYCASFARAVAEMVVAEARARAPKWAYPERKETRHWLKRTSQREELRRLLDIAREGQADIWLETEMWLHHVGL